MKGFKGYKKGVVCRGKQYKENTLHEENGEIKACSKGMHFCEMPLDVFDLYPPTIGNEYTEVEALGSCETYNNKTTTNKLFVKSKVSISRLFKLNFELVLKKIKNSFGSNTSGDNAHSNTSANNAHSNTSGDESIASGLGVSNKVKSSKGWIVLVDWRVINSVFIINNIHKAKVGKHKINGVKIESDTWYWFENGILKSSKYI